MLIQTRRALKSSRWARFLAPGAVQPKTVGIRSKPKGASKPETARTHSPGDSTLREVGTNEVAEADVERKDGRETGLETELRVFMLNSMWLMDEAAEIGGATSCWGRLIAPFDTGCTFAFVSF